MPCGCLLFHKQIQKLWQPASDQRTGPCCHQSWCSCLWSVLTCPGTGREEGERGELLKVSVFEGDCMIPKQPLTCNGFRPDQAAVPGCNCERDAEDACHCSQRHIQVTTLFPRQPPPPPILRVISPLPSAHSGSTPLPLPLPHLLCFIPPL